MLANENTKYQTTCRIEPKEIIKYSLKINRVNKLFL